MGKNAWAIVLTALAMRQNDLKFRPVGFALGCRQRAPMPGFSLRCHEAAVKAASARHLTRELAWRLERVRF